MVDNYIPSKGDIICVDFSPQVGHEQSGSRPAIVISHQKYNDVVGLMLVCPITSKIKNYPFEVTLQSSCTTKGVILSDQIKSLDWRARGVKFIEKVNKTTQDEILSKQLVILT